MALSGSAAGSIAQEGPQARLEDLLPYLPPPLVTEVLTINHLPEVRQRWCDGSILFADVAGFSAMSEALSLQGKSGAEEMTEILNRYFTTLLDVAGQYAGQAIKFAGDAVLLYFEGPGHAERAVACGLRMQVVMCDFATVHTSRGDFPLTVRVGVNSGQGYAASVGRASRRLEYLFTGPDVRGAIEAEEHAPKGHVAAGAKTAELLADRAVLSPLVKGFCKVERLEPGGAALSAPGPHPPDRSAAGDARAEKVRMLAAYLPQAVVQRVTVHRENLEALGEHRLVTVLFVNFGDLDALLADDFAAGRGDDLLSELNRYYEIIHEAVAFYGGIVARSDPMMHGDKILILFGAPVSHESDPEHAIRCALEINAQMAHQPLRIRHRIGIATGYAFSGNVGSPWHREYTVIGNAANLAARLMVKAGPGDILASASTTYGLEDQVVGEMLEPMRLKGFADLQPVCRVAGWQADFGSEAHSSLVDRVEEWGRLEEVIDRVLSGQGTMAHITGPAGIGKSALAGAAARTWRARDGLVLRASCESFGRNMPYLPWRDLLSEFFRFLPTDSAARRWRKIGQRVGELAPEWCNRLYVLGRLFDLPPVPDVVIPDDLDPRLWQTQFHRSVTDLLRGQARREPLLLVAEDMHWCDQASLALLTYLAGNLEGNRILLLLTYRAGTTSHQLQGLHQDALSLVLDTLSEEDCRELSRELLNAGFIADDLLAQVWSSSRGNPLYLKEVLRHLRANGYIGGEPGGVWTLRQEPGTIPIPTSMERILIGTLDQLDESRRQAIRVASVIGRQFPVRALQALYLRPSTEIHEMLERLAQQDLIRPEQPRPDPGYGFAEPWFQEVTYDTLAFARRRQLHRQLGLFFEQEAGERLSEQYALLAYHYDLGQDRSKAFEYHLKAADQARLEYANHEAVYHYGRALDILPKLPARPAAPLLIDAYRDHGRVCRFAGLLDDALESYRQGLVLAQAEQDRLREAQIWVWMADLCNVQGKGRDVMEHAGRAVALAADLDARDLLEFALEYVGGAHLLLGALPDALGCFERCLDLSRDLHNAPGMLRSLNNIGLIHIYRSQYGRALIALDQALTVARELQDYFYIIILANNLGEIHQELFDARAAVPLHEEARALAHQFGLKDLECDSLRNLAVDLAMTGDIPQATAKLMAARGLAITAGLQVAEASVLYSLGEIHLRAEAVPQALAAAQELGDLAAQLGIPVIQARAHLLRGLVYQVQGEAGAALAALRQAIELGEQALTGRYGIQLYSALAELTRPHDASASARALEQAGRLVAAVADTLGDSELRDRFLAAAEVRRVCASA